LDSEAKAEFQHKQKAREVSDFESDNVFSYIYTTKQHKSHEYAKKKDAVIDLIKDQFTNARYNPETANQVAMKQMAVSSQKKE